MSKKQEKSVEVEESFLDPSLPDALQAELDKKAETEAARANLLEHLKDPALVKQAAVIEDLERKIATAQSNKAKALALQDTANREVSLYNRELDVLVTQLDALKNRTRNQGAENMLYLEAQAKLHAEKVQQQLAKREIAVQMGLLTPQQAAAAGLSPIDLAIANRNIAARKAAVRG